MSTSSKLRTDFKIAVDHIRDRVVSNVTEAKRQGRYKIEDEDLKRLINVINSSFEQGFVNSAGQIEKSINEAMR